MSLKPTQAEATRHKVLTAWGAQDRPMVLAPRLQHAQYWLTYNDEFLQSQGPYINMIATAYSTDRLRGWRGTLVVIRAERIDPPPRWEQALELVSNTPGISIWTETLP